MEVRTQRVCVYVGVKEGILYFAMLFILQERMIVLNINGVLVSPYSPTRMRVELICGKSKM